MLFKSLKNIKGLDGKIRIYPGHGSGSACGKSIGAGNFCLLETQKEKNYALKIEDEKEFIKIATEDLNKPPGYFFHDVKLNQEGITGSPYEEQYNKCLNKLKVEEFAKLAETMPVIETRADPVGGIIKNAYWLPSKGSVCNWASMIMKPETEFIVFAEEKEIASVINRFLRIGFVGMKGFNAFDMSEWKGETFQPIIVDGAKALETPKRLHLDVRNPPEFVQKGVIENSLTIPLPEVEKRAEEVKNALKDEVLFISCQSGMRARFACGILRRKGI